MPKIKVGEKALAHLSRGLYRSPASALRELVSNGWDANATEVRIDTSFPNFSQLAIYDNGDGFTRDEFAKLMEGGIGNSNKRPSNKVLINDRPLIGRLGIGMLGIAQICGSFVIASRPKNGEPFRAKVHLYDLLKDTLDHEGSVKEVEVGEYDFEEFNPSEVRKGTLIISDEVHPTFSLTFQKSLEFELYEKPPAKWKDSLQILSNIHSLQQLGDYWRLLWELAASCPVPYVSSRALPDGLIAERQRLLESFDFTVIVDGRELFKPVFLQDNPEGLPILRTASGLI